MLLFRIICAILMAWATNWVMSQPEAGGLLAALPEMGTIGPIAAAAVGFVNLASRQGWGVVVAVANGVWAAILAIAMSGVLYMAWFSLDAVRKGMIKDFEGYLRIAGAEMSPLFDLVVDVPLVILTITAMAVLSIFTELLHWTLVRLRRNRQDASETVPR